MLLGKKSRYFVRHELQLKPPRLAGHALPLQSGDDTQDVFGILQEAIDDKSAAFEVKAKDTVRITKLDLRPKEDMAVLLIRRRDEEAATQVFEHGGTGALWQPDVDPKQAPAVSAHLFVRLTPSGGPFPVHRTILEEVPGLGRTYIEYILRQLLKPVEYEYTDERGKVKTAYTIAKLAGLPSKTLGDALKGGGINYVELVGPAETDGLDMRGLKAHPQRMRLSVSSDENPLNVVARVRDWAAQNNWPTVRVQVETADDRTKVVEIARAADAADVLFVKSELVTTKNDVAICTDDINDELAGLAAKRLADDADW